MIDVLFILVFAALAQRAVNASSADASAELESDGSEAPPPSTSSLDAAIEDGVDGGSKVVPVGNDFDSAVVVGRSAATAKIAASEVIVVRVAGDGIVTAVENGENSDEVAVPLLERVADPDIALAYLGDRSPELRICQIAARSFPVDGRLVIVASDLRQSDLRVALVAGLRRDVERCREQGAMAVLIDSEPEGSK